MFDFLKVVKTYQKERYHYKPTFIVKSSIKDIMTRGGAFYAIFDEETGYWTKSKPRAIELIDKQVREYAAKDAGPEAMADTLHGPHIQYMADSSNMLSTQFDRFCKTMGDNWIALDQKMIFSNTEVKKHDYASKCLDYPLVESPTPYYDALVSVLYSPDEQEKWEWAVGAMIAGEQNKIQKMFAFYGEPGTGKSTIISKIFADQIFGGLDMGYAVKFEANNVVGGDSFGTDFLENDSVLVYDDDAELGVINCRSTLNKIISHESIRVNCKFKAPFMTKSNCMIFIGSNDPIQLSPNSGMKRRLIDIRPTGILVDADTYDDCMEHIPFEKSGIAWRCLQVYKTKGRHYYDHYVAEDMLKYIIKYVLENAPEEMEFFNKFVEPGLIDRLENVINNEFERITYTKAIELLTPYKDQFKYSVEWEAGLQTEHERFITEKIYKKPVFVTDYPAGVKAFYMKQNPDGKTVAAVDLLVPGVGEIIGGSQREENYEVLMNKIKEQGMNEETYKAYLDTRKYGTVVHSGFGLGFERMVMYLTGMSNIRDVIPFPRTTGSAEF